MGPEALARALARPARPSSDYDLNPGFGPPEGRALRAAAVLVAVWDRPGGPRLVLTKRGTGLRHHPGQVAFPGGKVEAGEDAAACALREAREEVALDPAAVAVLGALPPHETVTGFAVTPVVGWIGGAFAPRPEAGEVEEVFTVPLAHVADPARFRVESRAWRGGVRRYYAVPWGPYYIWGATARILRGLADRLAA